MAEITYYDVGDSIRTSMEFFDEDGEYADPTTVTFRYKIDRGGTPVVYEYGVDVEVVRDGVGIYHCDIVLLQSDPYYVKWQGEGVVDSVEENVIYVRQSYFE